MLTVLQPALLWLLLALGLVLAIHFLRRKRRPMLVSAVFLWEEAQRLQRQRRRFSLSSLLISQLLVVLFVVLALSQLHYLRQTRDERIVILDVSASMAAKAQGQEYSRLERAVRDVEELLAESSSLAIILAGEEAQLYQNFSGNRAEVARALQDIKAVQASADIERAFQLATSLQQDRPVAIHLFSDDITIKDQNLHVHPISDNAENIGITAFSVDSEQAFVVLHSSFLRPQELNLRLYHQDRLVSQSSVLIASQGQVQQSLATLAAPGEYRLEVEPPTGDALELDNSAHAFYQQLSVLVSPPQEAFERAFLAIPNVELSISPQALTAYDLVIRPISQKTPVPLHHQVLYSDVQASRPQGVASQDRLAPLMRFVELEQATFAVADIQPHLSANSHILAESSTLSPLIFQQEEAGLQQLYFAFHPSQTDVIYQPAFPILLSNLVRSLAQAQAISLGSYVAALNSVVTEPGIYTAQQDGAQHRYSANLFSPAESQLHRPLQGQAYSQTTEESDSLNGQDRGLSLTTQSSSQLSLVPWLLALGLGVLVLEWLLFSYRRP